MPLRGRATSPRCGLFGLVGDDNVIEAARELGVRSPIEEGDPSVALGSSTMTLMELTAAYAGIAANEFPVTPTAFVAEEPGWLDSLFDGKDSLGSGEHEDLERMLRGAGQPRHRARCDAVGAEISARPAPRRTTAMRCSSAMPAGWWSGCGSATTTTRRCRASPAARCRRGSGRIS
jgi:hypothetical protein